jgi:hypothetical protein
LPLTSAPGAYSLTAGFGGDAASAASGDGRPFAISRIGTTLTLSPTPPPAVILGADSAITATLKDASGTPLGFRTIFFFVTGAATRTTTATTDFAGRAQLGVLPSAVGFYTVTACFNNAVEPAACASLALPDRTYGPAGVATPVQQIWPFTGFMSPVDNLPTVNTATAGQAIPVKFGLGGNRGLQIIMTGYPKAVVTTCGTAPQDAIEETVTANSSGLQFDAASGNYTYVWKTDKATMAGKCVRLDILLVDGTLHQANFKLK